MNQFLTLLSLFHRWLDKLGIAALTNHTRVFRQSFIGGHYSLLDSNQYPLPVSVNSQREVVGGEEETEGEREGRVSIQVQQSLAAWFVLVGRERVGNIKCGFGACSMKC